jgi:adiponectin receptor
MNHEIPIWTKNRYIVSGYRKSNSNKLGCIISIFKIHNETINIWTHFIGLLYFLYNLILNVNENTALVLYEIVCVICFGISTIYHTYMPYSQQNYMLLLKMDLISIILNIVTSNILIYHYWFWCYDDIKNIYNFISLLYLGVGFVILLNVDIIKRYNYILAYYSLYNFGIVISYYHINIISNGNINEIIKYNFIKSLQYFGIGFIIYTTKMPERIVLQYFDIYGSSHQLWHIFSFMGSYYYHEEIIKNINYRLIDNCYYCFNNASAMAALTSNCVI